MGTQPRRAPASPAERQAEARADVERIARAFHETYERLAPAHGYKTREASAVAWENVPEQNADLMRAVVSVLLAADVIRVGQRPVAERPMAGQTTIDDYC